MVPKATHFSGSRVFAGNEREHTTLQGMLEGLGTPADALVIIDRGIATETQIAWLRESGYRYLIVSRKREFDAQAAAAVSVAPERQTLPYSRNFRSRFRNASSSFIWHSQTVSTRQPSRLSAASDCVSRSRLRRILVSQ